MVALSTASSMFSDTETPFCNTLNDGTQFCEAKPQPIVTSTAVEIVTVTNTPTPTPLAAITSTITSTSTVCPEQPTVVCEAPIPEIPVWNNGTTTKPVPVYPEETPVLIVTPPVNNVTVPEGPKPPVEEEPEFPGAPDVPEESTGDAAVLKTSMSVLAGAVVAAFFL